MTVVNSLPRAAIQKLKRRARLAIPRLVDNFLIGHIERLNYLRRYLRRIVPEVFCVERFYRFRAVYNLRITRIVDFPRHNEVPPFAVHFHTTAPPVSWRERSLADYVDSIAALAYFGITLQRFDEFFDELGVVETFIEVNAEILFPIEDKPQTFKLILFASLQSRIKIAPSIFIVGLRVLPRIRVFRQFVRVPANPIFFLF